MTRENCTTQSVELPNELWSWLDELVAHGRFPTPDAAVGTLLWHGRVLLEGDRTHVENGKMHYYHAPGERNTEQCSTCIDEDVEDPPPRPIRNDDFVLPDGSIEPFDAYLTRGLHEELSKPPHRRACLWVVSHWVSAWAARTGFPQAQLEELLRTPPSTEDGERRRVWSPAGHLAPLSP